MKPRTCAFCTVLLFFLVIFSIPYPLVSQKKKEKKTIVDTMSVESLKKFAASELTKYQELTGGLKLLSKIFGDHLKASRQALDRWDIEKKSDIESIFLRGVLEKSDLNYSKADSLFSIIKNETLQYSTYGFDNIWMQLGDVYNYQNEHEKAVEAYKQGALLNLEDTWPLIKISFSYMEINKADEASEAFYAGLNDIKSDKFIDRLFIDVQDIATKDEVNAWKSLTSREERLEYLKIFWKRRDPNPTDKINQRLIEHYNRLSVARQRYSKSIPPFYDERGTVYIRLGKPNLTYYGKSGMNIRENESWLYKLNGEEIPYDFVNMGSGFELRSLFDAAINTISWIELINLFDERSSLHHSYTKIALKIKAKSNDLKSRLDDQIADGIISGVGEATIKGQSVRNFSFSNEFSQNDFADNLSKYEKFDFEFDAGAPHLPINFNVASFKSTTDMVRLEFYYALPFSELVFLPSINHPDKHSSVINLILKIFDQKYNEVRSISNQYKIDATTNEKMTHFFIDQVVMDSLRPGKYNLALDIRNNEKDRVGIYQFSIFLKDYSSDTLTVSNIEIAQYVETTLSKDRYLKPKSNLRVVPNPAAGIVKTKPLWIYYEIYNLTLNNEGKSSYQVSYSIKMSELDQSFLSSVAGLFSSKQDAGTSSITTKEGKSINEKEYIAFDISELPKGIATMEVKIKDLLSGKETVSAINLTLIEEEKKNLNEKK